ncbi:MAG TPA: HEAT repeat domain-containing protein [Gemmata sp.]|nr:HEAT repeat domain-containing protein [Gemmata sp.]
MAKRKSSTGSALGLIVATGLVLAGHAVAQQPTVPPQVPTTDPQQAITPPPAPTVTPVILPTVIAPSSGAAPALPAIPGVPVQLNDRGPVPVPVPFQPPQQVQRFNFKINPNTPIKELLPTPPTSKPVTGPVLADDLTKVPEAEFQARPEKVAQDGKQAERIAHQLAKINHVNANKTDAFMTALLENRDDLAGLPFAMGDDCRTSVERTKQFTQAVASVRRALANPNGEIFQTEGRPSAPFQPGTVTSVPQGVNGNTPTFWSQYRIICENEDAAQVRADKTKCEQVTLARIAALMQLLAPETPEIRLGMVKYLTSIPLVEATKALARLAIFSPEDEVRFAAIDALKVRREKDYTEIFVQGLRYPWPAVAKRSADAIARMGRSDLIPELVAVLASEDPRMPTTKSEDSKQVPTIREMVKVNHHRNCMMCHAPGNPSNVSSNAITAEVPIPGQPLPSQFEGYRQSSFDLMIRVDVTYLRQDFSALLPVADAHPWPDLQRFDFFIRERKLTSEEADIYKVKLTAKEEGVLSPYHKAALAALRELTGKDTAPTAEAWRKLLNLPAPPAVKAD